MDKYNELFKDENFIKNVVNKKICLFLGAGVAKNLGMPSWSELATDICDFCFKNVVFDHSKKQQLCATSDKLKIISYCLQQIKNNEKLLNKLNALLIEKFITNPNAEYKKCSIYKNIVELYNSGKILIVQTNYDNVIENNIDNKKANPQPYIPYLDSPKTELKNNLVLKYVLT